MSMHNRVFEHSLRRLHTRQDGGSGQDGQRGREGQGGGSEESQSSTGTPETTSQSNSSSPSTTASTTSESSTTSTSTSETSTSSSTSTPSTTSTTPTSTSTSISTSSTTSQTSELTSTSTSSSPSPSTSSTASSQLSTSSSSESILVTTSNSLTATGNLVAPTTDTDLSKTFTPTGSFSGPQTTESSKSSPAVSGSLNSGAVAGGVVGGLVGAAILGVLILMFIRRKRAKDHASQFDAAQFRRSAMIMEDVPTNTHYPSPNSSLPPQREMVFQGRDQVASMRSSLTAGMAGQGAWAFHGSANEDEYQQYNQYAQYEAQAPTGYPVYQDHPEGKPSAEYYSDSFAQQLQSSTAPASTRQAIQPRQQYTFGSTYAQNRDIVSDDGQSDHEEAASVYSTQTPRQSVQVENPFASEQDVHGRMYNMTANSGLRNSSATVDAYGGI
ncbi:hypothetical protein E1B28_007987 [Marasmius oreades]|uniref:Uncharacterized protein n=1 Tax=Marasmius oreades TaxID=181124 RepID=A0A9P7S3F0_9AGAR|nr:uncharacterized protein E1B28_007987 [Marasmius oreades]KAG7094387.1 hypothetical protein E1B28_007987 [Marasmius oreades]